MKLSVEAGRFDEEVKKASDTSWTSQNTSERV